MGDPIQILLCLDDEHKKCEIFAYAALRYGNLARDGGSTPARSCPLRNLHNK